MLAFLFNTYMTPTVSRPSKMGETMPWVKPDCLAQAGIETPAVSLVDITNAEPCLTADAPGELSVRGSNSASILSSCPS